MLVHPFGKAVGIEVLKDLHDMAVELGERFRRLHLDRDSSDSSCKGGGASGGAGKGIGSGSGSDSGSDSDCGSKPTTTAHSDIDAARERDLFFTHGVRTIKPPRVADDGKDGTDDGESKSRLSLLAVAAGTAAGGKSGRSTTGMLSSEGKGADGTLARAKRGDDDDDGKRGGEDDGKVRGEVLGGYERHVDGTGGCGEPHRMEADFRFVHGDLQSEDLKWWEDADVVYCNTLAFGETLLTTLTALLCRMKP